MFPWLDRPLWIVENQVQLLVIEDPVVLRRTLRELSEQIAGEPGRVVLGVDDVPVELSEAAVLITDPFRPWEESRKLTNRVLQEASMAAGAFPDCVGRVLLSLQELASEVCAALDFNAACTVPTGPEPLMRLLGVRADVSDLDVAELLLETMRLHQRLLGKRLFFLYGVRRLLTREELEQFYRSIFYEKLSVVLLEPAQTEAQLPGEVVTILDRDLCIIR